MGSALSQHRQNGYTILEEDDMDEAVDDIVDFDAKNTSREIDRQIRTEKLKRKTMQNILLLGKEM